MQTAVVSPNTSSRRGAYLLLAAAIAIGSVSFTLVKVVLEQLSPLGLATGRVVVSAVMFVAVVARSPWRRTPILRADRVRVILCGLGGSALFHIFFAWGQQHVSVAIASIVMATMPTLVAIGEVAFLAHRLTPRHVLGLVLSTVGCAAIGLAAGGSGGSSLLGAGAIALAALIWAAVTVATRSIATRYDSWWLNTPGTVLGALLILAVEAPHLAEFGHLSLEVWLFIVWLGSASSAFIYFVMARVMTVFSATTAMSLGTIVTPTSVMVAWVVLGDAPGPLELVAGAVVVAGVVLVTHPGGRQAAPTS